MRCAFGPQKGTDLSHTACSSTDIVWRSYKLSSSRFYFLNAEPKRRALFWRDFSKVCLHPNICLRSRCVVSGCFPLENARVQIYILSIPPHSCFFFLLLQFIVECHGNTLLPQFLGMYRLTVDGVEIYMIVTRNVFSHRLSVYRKYDLKVRNNCR